MKVLETKALGSRARLFYLAGVLLSVSLIAFGLTLLRSSSTEDSTVKARNVGHRIPLESSLPTYWPTQYDGAAPQKSIGNAPTGSPSYEQSSGTPTERTKKLRGDTPAPSENPSHAPTTASLEESSTGPSVSSSTSEQPSENTSEAPMTTTLYPSSVQPTTPQPTLSSPTQTIDPYWGEFLSSLENQCGNEFGQSPIDLCTAPSSECPGYQAEIQLRLANIMLSFHPRASPKEQCQEFHEYRSRPGDFGIESQSMDKQILANKLVSLLHYACVQTLLH